MAKFLDENGVKKLWSRIQEYIYECGCNNCSGDGGETGYECTESYTTLFDGSVTTAKDNPEASYAYASFTPSQDATAHMARITFNGKEYLCERCDLGAYGFYGTVHDSEETDWSEYPFIIGIGMYGDNLQATLETENEGTYSLKFEDVRVSAEPTPCFISAVQKAYGDRYDIVVTSVEDNVSEAKLVVGDYSKIKAKLQSEQPINGYYVKLGMYGDYHIQTVRHLIAVEEQSGEILFKFSLAESTTERSVGVTVTSVTLTAYNHIAVITTTGGHADANATNA